VTGSFKSWLAIQQLGSQVCAVQYEPLAKCMQSDFIYT